MSKESVIALNSYERHSFFRFFFIYTLALVLLFSALASLYYYKERQRYFQEQKVQNRVAFSECQHLKKMLPSAPECKMEPVIIENKLQNIYREIVYAFLLSLLLILPFGYFLAYLSLRPMREAVSAMDGFINGIVHDINTPLSVIRMNAQSINKLVHDEKAKKKLTRLLQGVEQVESLEEQLLFTIKIGQYALQKEHFDLGALLQERVHYYASIRQSICINIEAFCFEVNADKAAMLRMIDNIVLNAIKYSPAHKEVKIFMKEGTLFIQDHGVGIKHPKKVFDKYYREAKESKGVGIGLYIVAQIAQLHHLDITISSTLGVGTTFMIPCDPISTLTLHTSTV